MFSKSGAEHLRQASQSVLMSIPELIGVLKSQQMHRSVLQVRARMQVKSRHMKVVLRQDLKVCKMAIVALKAMEKLIREMPSNSSMSCVRANMRRRKQKVGVKVRKAAVVAVR